MKSFKCNGDVTPVEGLQQDKQIGLIFVSALAVVEHYYCDR